MSANFHPQSAKIYEFPPRGRFSGSSQAAQGAAFTKLAQLGAAKAVIGSSWYHDQAIEEERARKD